MRSFVQFIPIATTLVSLSFAVVLFRRYRQRQRTHLLWFAAGALTFAAGTITESATTLFGWHEGLFRAWYITGALLGGAPLAQGTVYLLLPRKVANWLTAILLPVIIIASTAVLLTPIDYSLVEPFRLSGKVIVWHWVRGFSPFINLYAVIFLIGGAILSAYRYSGNPATRGRFIGNVLIAVGAVLPGIGGVFTRFGHTEVLYVTEFLGIITIWAGYQFNVGATRETTDAAGDLAGARPSPGVPA